MSEPESARIGFRVLVAFEDSALTEPGLHVLRSPEDFGRFWSVLESCHCARYPAPDVDWHQEMVIVVALGTRPSSGYGVRVELLTELRGVLTVHTRSFEPGDDEFVTDALTQPYTAIATAPYQGTIITEPVADRSD